jgi:2-oxoglutarate ferredoxin oxidoreductase subunit gamma
MVTTSVTRSDVSAFYVPATALAEDNGLKGLANIVLTGKLWAEFEFCELDTLKAAIKKSVPASKAALLESNLKALEIGMNYK